MSYLSDGDEDEEEEGGRKEWTRDVPLVELMEAEEEIRCVCVCVCVSMLKREASPSTCNKQA